MDRRHQEEVAGIQTENDRARFRESKKFHQLIDSAQRRQDDSLAIMVDGMGNTIRRCEASLRLFEYQAGRNAEKVMSLIDIIRGKGIGVATPGGHKDLPKEWEDSMEDYDQRLAECEKDIQTRLDEFENGMSPLSIQKRRVDRLVTELQAITRLQSDMKPREQRRVDATADDLRGV